MRAPADIVLADLTRALGADAVIARDEIPDARRRDWMVAMTGGAPLALVRPRSTAEVSSVLRICHSRATPVVPQGGLTGLVGGATPVDGCVILSLERMAAILDVDPAAAVMSVEAGVTLHAVQRAADEAGFFFPLDLGARGSAQVGGLIATNAGGNRVIRYGMMRDLVLGLEVVLADGTVVDARSTLVKNNAGFDVRQVFVGSEGTLGVITRAVLRLHPKPRSRCTALCAVSSYDHVPPLLQHARAETGGSLSAFEAMWADYYDMVTSRVSGLARPLAGAPIYVLLDVLGSDQPSDQARFEQMLERAAEDGLVDDAVVAQSEAEARRFWDVRDATGEFPRILWPHVAFDVGIPTAHIGAFVDRSRAALLARWPAADPAFYGHIGDSNLHLCVKVCEGEQPEHDVEAIVYDLVREYGGTISAEHGIGVRKRAFLPHSRSDEAIGVMRAIKQALDPAGILNPGKVVG